MLMYLNILIDKRIKTNNRITQKRSKCLYVRLKSEPRRQNGSDGNIVVSSA